jgi:hypothetical protein
VAACCGKADERATWLWRQPELNTAAMLRQGRPAGDLAGGGSGKMDTTMA